MVVRTMTIFFLKFFFLDWLRAAARQSDTQMGFRTCMIWLPHVFSLCPILKSTMCNRIESLFSFVESRWDGTSFFIMLCFVMLRPSLDQALCTSLNLALLCSSLSSRRKGGKKRHLGHLGTPIIRLGALRVTGVEIEMSILGNHSCRLHPNVS